MIHEFTNPLLSNDLISIPDYRSDVQQGYSLARLDNDASPDLATVQNLADEIISISGRMIDLYFRTSNEDIDKVWDEDPDPTYWEPHKIRAYFKPVPLESELTKFGIDATNKTTIVFTKKHIELLNYRYPRSGDVIMVPMGVMNNRSEKFLIVDAKETGQFRYNWLYISCICESLMSDITIIPNLIQPPQSIRDPNEII